MNRILLVFAMSIFCLFGCTDTGVKVSTSKNPDATEILKLDSNADIFQWEDAIYQSGIEWVDELELEENEQIGKIDFIVKNGEEFENGAANILPIGASIYSVKDRDDILILKYKHEIKRYVLLSEG